MSRTTLYYKLKKDGLASAEMQKKQNCSTNEDKIQSTDIEQVLVIIGRKYHFG